MPRVRHFANQWITGKDSTRPDTAKLNSQKDTSAVFGESKFTALSTPIDTRREHFMNPGRDAEGGPALANLGQERRGRQSQASNLRTAETARPG